MPADATNSGHRLCVAPMMALTDRHCRYFHRQLSPHARLYTEMLTTGAILHGDRRRLLAFDPAEHPLALQIGGSDPREMTQAARIASDLGFDEININVGCPSERVRNASFGACLMADPARVADCVAAMRAAVAIPVTVKTRIGIDDHDDYAFFDHFVTTVSAAGCRHFIVHARKAWLAGVSPKANRELPPLRYDRVYRLKREHPELTVVVNGGIADAGSAAAHLDQVDGVMLGRAAYQQPYLLAELEQHLFSGAAAAQVRRPEIVQRMRAYAARESDRGVALKQITRHLLGLFHGRPGGRRWRQTLSEQARLPGAGPALLAQALAAGPQRYLPEAA